jgi:hypothetical protein
MVNNNEIFQMATNPKRFFIEYLSLKKPVLEVMLEMVNKKKINLHPKLLHIFALILYYNNLYKDLPEDQRWKKVFDHDTKMQMMNEVGINEGHLNTYISILRNMHLLTGKQISSPFILYPESGFELTFKFNFEKDE